MQGDVLRGRVLSLFLTIKSNRTRTRAEYNVRQIPTTLPVVSLHASKKSSRNLPLSAQNLLNWCAKRA